MSKLTKAWVETHTRSDGKKFYTAHITFRKTVLWFIPYFYVHHICMAWSATHHTPAVYALCSNSSANYPYQFNSRQEAEDQLMVEIDKVLDKEKEETDAKVIESHKDYVPLCPINNLT